MTIKTLNNHRSTRIRLLTGSRLSPIERQMGRTMRAPDEHADATSSADAADPAPTTALGDAATADPAAEDATATTDVTDADKAGGDKNEADDGKKDGEGDDKTDAADSIVGAPEDYDVSAFTMPEGVEFDAEMFDLVKDDLKGMDLSQKGAERIVGLFAEKVVPKISERAVQQLDDHAAELRANMARDLQADPEVGGAKLKESQAYAAKAIAHFIPDAAVRSDFSKFLNESGLGDHPLLTRVIAGAGRAISEASTPPGETAKAELTASEKFYGRKA
jgi:hypothetical protein